MFLNVFTLVVLCVCVFNLSDVGTVSAVQTRIITSVAAITQTQMQPLITNSASAVTTGTVTMGTVSAGTAIQLTPQQQTLLARVQGQLKALASNPSRTPEQERFLHLLVNAQQQIHAQGRSQMQAALAAGKTVASAVPIVSLTATPTKPTASTKLSHFYHCLL